MKNEDSMTFGEHLEVFRKLLFRILIVALFFGATIFCVKDLTFDLLLAPSQCDFCTYRWIESLCSFIGFDFHFEKFHINLISTELSSQFMTHLSTSVYLSLLCTSPYIVLELFGFVSPALYDSERKYAIPVAVVIYVLFICGLMMSYFILFPISFRFLGTYQVSKLVVSTITLDSYIDTFVTLTMVMGLVFELPVVAFFLAKMHIIDYGMMANYRRHAFLVICLVAAIITPPDLFTLVLVALPLYMLYEISIRIVYHCQR